MSAAAALDPQEATRLATLDPSLAPLAAVLGEAAGRHAPAGRWELHDARWTPGAGCRLAYRVVTGADVTFEAVTVDAEGWRRHGYRDDPRLPGLQVAADPDAARRRLAGTLGEEVASCVVVPVRYRPGQRCVLRYDVETASRRVTCFAKVLREEPFAAAAPLVRALGADPHTAPLVPEVTDVWEDAQTMLTGTVPGRSLSAVLLDPLVPGAERARVAHRLGALLAEFHAATLRAVPHWAPEDQLASLTESLAAASVADPRLAAQLTAAAVLLERRSPGPGPEVITHGAFRAGNAVLEDTGRVVVLDVEGVCRSSSGRDLGTVLAHLAWQGVRHPQQHVVAEQASHALLAGYQDGGGDLDLEATTWWRAAALLQVAARRFRRLETLDWPRTPALVAAAITLVEGRQGRTLPVRQRDLLDPVVMTGVLDRTVSASRRRGPLRVESAAPLTRSTGRRGVVRYAVRGLDGPHVSQVVGKSFADPARAALLARTLELLAASGAPTPVPELLGHEPWLGLVVLRHHEGIPLSRLPLPRVPAAVAAAARWLADLHGRQAPLPRHLDLGQERRSAGEWAGVVGLAQPALKPAALRLAQEWPALLQGRPVAPEVPLHKDFHPEHVLVDLAGGGVAVVDLDEARLGDPAFDLGHACAYLDEAQVRRSGREPGADPLGRAWSVVFVEAYAAAAGPVDPVALAAWRGYAWLKIARQLVSASPPFQSAAGADRAARATDAVTRGLACLSA